MPIIKSQHGFSKVASGLPSPSNERAINGLQYNSLNRDDGLRFEQKYEYLFDDLAGDDKNLIPHELDEAQYLKALKFLSRQMDKFMPDIAEERLLPGAIFTYLGQFIDHDISAATLAAPGSRVDAGGVIIADANSLDELSGPRKSDTASIISSLSNQHVAPLLLGSLYGEPDFSKADPETTEMNDLYEDGDIVFKLADTEEANENDNVPQRGEIVVRGDYPRRPNEPLIADRRNDDNLILGQLHLLFMKFHNAAAREFPKDRFPDRNARLSACRALVTRHFHWLIIDAFLDGMLDPGALGQQFADKSKTTLRAEIRTSVPIEFTTAAFRFGHSMVRSEYDYNNLFNRNSGRGAFLPKLFTFTSIGGLGGHRQLPTIWLIDWDRFLPRGAARPATPARPIDIQISRGMNALPRQTTDPAHADIAQRIADRNLLRGFYRRLPSGQLLAKALNADIVSGEKILGMMLSQGEAADQDQVRNFILANGLHEHTPAWYYFLCEAAASRQGTRLGSAASTIIARTILGFIRAHGLIYDRTTGERNWTPNDSPLRIDGRPIATLRDIVDFVQQSAAIPP